MKIVIVSMLLLAVGCAGSGPTGNDLSFKSVESDSVKNGNSYVVPDPGFSIGGIEYTNGKYWEPLPPCVDVAKGTYNIYIIDNCDTIKPGSEIRIIKR